MDENTFCSIASSESADDGDFCMKRPQKALKQGESGETTQGPPMPRQEILSTSKSCNPKFGALIVDIEDLQKGQSFQVNSVEEVKSYVKTQANCRNFKALVGKGSGGGKYHVLEMVCSRSGFAAKNAALLKGESYNPKKKKSKHQNSPTKTDSSLLCQFTKQRERKSSSFKCGCEWKISFSFSKSISGSGIMCTVLSDYLRHTNGCIPTPLQW